MRRRVTIWLTTIARIEELQKTGPKFTGTRLLCTEFFEHFKNFSVTNERFYGETVIRSPKEESTSPEVQTIGK
jgi:hypothetical protein